MAVGTLVCVDAGVAGPSKAVRRLSPILEGVAVGVAVGTAVGARRGVCGPAHSKPEPDMTVAIAVGAVIMAAKETEPTVEEAEASRLVVNWPTGPVDVVASLGGGHPSSPSRERARALTPDGAREAAAEEAAAKEKAADPPARGDARHDRVSTAAVKEETVKEEAVRREAGRDGGAAPPLYVSKAAARGGAAREEAAAPPLYVSKDAGRGEAAREEAARGDGGR